MKLTIEELNLMRRHAIPRLQPTRVTGGLPTISCVCGGYFDPQFCIACGCERDA